jgi:hypothetical protein
MLLSLLDCAFAAFAKNSTEENNNDRMMSVIEYFFILMEFNLQIRNMNLI